MKIIDFDGQFQLYAGRFIQKNKARIHSADQAEALMPELYEKWCRTPKSWLDQRSPRQFFEGYAAPGELVALMRSYLEGEMTPPSLLMDRLVDLPGAEAVLLPLIWDGDDQMAVMALGMLIELESAAPLEDCVRMILENNRAEEVLDTAVEALVGMVPAPLETVLQAVGSAPSADAQARLADVLVKCGPDPRILACLLRLFSNSLAYTGLYAAYLGDYGDLQALPVLREALERPHLSYLDYIEVVHAIEALGDEVDIHRDYAGDPQYEALRNMEGMP